VDGKVVSMGPTFNTPFDDLAIMFESDTSGYFTSDRFSSGKDDDIIRFIIERERIAPPKDTLISDLPVIAATITKEEALQQLVAAKNAVDSLRSSAIKAGVSSDVFSFLDLSLEQFKQNFPTSFEGKNIDEINAKISELKAILALVNQQMDIVNAQSSNTTVAQTPKDEINVDVINAIIDQTKIENIHFKFDSYEITPEYQTYLRGLAMLFKANPEWQVSLSGHTDGVGNAAYNLELSKNRAKSTKSFLERNGITPERVAFDFFGMTKPIASNGTPEGRYLNRRVEIKVAINGKTIIEGVN
jgi:outer membrane protein OmpA-like peptidoglycan-associated protein